jgi:non-heme chloroperoxidase
VRECLLHHYFFFYPETTEYVEIEGRGHSLILDHGWPDVANPALTFLKRFL